MNAQLTELGENLRANARQAQSLVWKCTPEQLAKRPQPDSWSAAECLAHLTLTTELFLPRWRGAIAAARAGGLIGDGPFKADLVGKLMHWVLEPGRRIRAKAPANLAPVLTGEELKNFLDAQNQWLELLPTADRLALDRIRIPSPVAEQVRYNVWASLCIAEVHQRRHLQQAEHAISGRAALTAQ